jgi:hypothetical protein
MLIESSQKVANIYTCLNCHYSTCRKSSYDKHLITAKHIKIMENSKKVSHEYICLICDYTTSKKNNYDKHLTTSKHINLIESSREPKQKIANNYECLNCDYNTSQFDNSNTNNKQLESSQKVAENSQKVASHVLVCDICNKTYKSTVGLWKHKKMCSLISNETIKYNNKDESSDKELVMILLKENSDFKNMIMKLVENGVNCNNNNNNNNNITNSHNKAFNLNFFLNETCKNAMNISDFVDSLQLQLSDLESIGDIGYIEGISKIIVKSLKALDETERPIHCTDKKRETFYIKDDDKWEKEDDNKTHIRKAIKYVANKNTLLVPQWKAKYPDYNNSSSIQSDKYNNMIIEVLGGDDETEQSENKIIKKIAREVIIDK